MTDKRLPLAEAWQKRKDLHELSYQLLVQCRVRVRYYMWQCHLPNGDIYE